MFLLLLAAIARDVLLLEAWTLIAIGRAVRLISTNATTSIKLTSIIVSFVKVVVVVVVVMMLLMVLLVLIVLLLLLLILLLVEMQLLLLDAE